MITNKINDKRYIGQTTKTIVERFRRHCWNCTYKNNMPIALAIKKYGKENFAIEEVCQCRSQEELDDMEVHYAKAYNTFSPHGYNLRAGNGPGSMSEETKEKIRQANLGKKVSEETRRRLSESHKGIRQSESTKKKLSDFNKGKKLSTLAQKRRIEATQKTYVIYNPQGSLVTITNMRKFCLENELNVPLMNGVVRGKKLHHNGWTLDPNLHKLAIEQRSRCKTNRYFFIQKGYFEKIRSNLIKNG